MRCLSCYVQLMPNDIDAVEKLALMSAKQAYEGNVVRSPRMFWDAYARLDNAVRKAPNRQAARREFVKMAMFARRYQDAREHLQGFLLKESPKDPELLEQLGKCQMEMADYDLALETFKKAIENGPNHFTAYLQLAQLLRSRLSRPKDADQWMARLVEANPRSAEAHVFARRLLAARRCRRSP